MFQGGGLDTAGKIRSWTKKQTKKKNNLEVILIIWIVYPENQLVQVHNPTLYTRNVSQLNIDVTFGLKWLALWRLRVNCCHSFRPSEDQDRHLKENPHWDAA